MAARDWGESVLDLPPNLATVPNRFTPATYRMLNATDTDFGSGGVVLLPPVQGQTAPPMAVAIGKDATLYLLDQAHLGGRTADDSGALQSLRIAKSGNGTWGGPAYYDGDQTGPMIYVQTDGSVLHAYSLSAGSSPKLTHAADGTTTAGLWRIAADRFVPTARRTARALSGSYGVQRRWRWRLMMRQRWARRFSRPIPRSGLTRSIIRS